MWFRGGARAPELVVPRVGRRLAQGFWVWPREARIFALSPVKNEHNLRSMVFVLVSK